MTQTTEARPARRRRREPLGHLRAIPFMPSGRDDCIATARMTFEEYLALDYEGGLAEWVDGEVRLYTSATNIHQRTIEFLLTLMKLFCEVTGAGVIRTAPYAMEARRGGSGREPDLTFVAAARVPALLRESHLSGRPDLVIEVVSKDSVRRDYEEKFLEYRAAGIPEYWIIDPRPGFQRADFYTLIARDYRVMPIVDGVFRSDALPGFWLRPEWLFDEAFRAIDAVRQVLGDRAP